MLASSAVETVLSLWKELVQPIWGISFMQNGNFRAKANRAWDAAITLWKMMKKGDRLHQKIAVKAIRTQHGEEFIYQNRHANPAIHRHVLSLFEMFTEDKIVWAKQGHYWRWRRPGDPTDRREVIY